MERTDEHDDFRQFHEEKSPPFEPLAASCETHTVPAIDCLGCEVASLAKRSRWRRSRRALTRRRSAAAARSAWARRAATEEALLLARWPAPPSPEPPADLRTWAEVLP